MNQIDKYKAALDCALSMAKFINDHHEELNDAGLVIEEAAEAFKKIIIHCGQKIKERNGAKHDGSQPRSGS